ncbi:MAG TPA: AAA family ATPase [Nostocaceae cyanobacterium]|nr:AAA family ATPase [Nostocaceae cyanobacterium]
METLITIKNYRCFSEEKPAKIKIRKGFTAFIGVNNSGKSTLLKLFYELRYIFSQLSDFNTFFNVLTTSEPILKLPKEIINDKELFCNYNNCTKPMILEFNIVDDDVKNRPNFARKITINIDKNYFYSVFLPVENLIISNENNLYNLKCDKTQIVLPNERKRTDLYYLIRLFYDLSQALYIGAFRNSLNLVDITNPAIRNVLDINHLDYFDIKIGRNFMIQWREYKSGDDRNKKKSIIEITNDIKRIFNLEQLEINYYNDDQQSLELAINNNIYNLSELGSGLAQFILVLFNVAMKKPSYILIDEPELNLHPVLQLDFLTTLGKYASEGVLFATHSIGLARASAEYIYTVRPTPQGSEVNEYEKNPSLPELLGELSYSTYREFSFDKILLVEGPSEIKTIQQFLRKYNQDHHILLLPLSGKSLINGQSKSELEEIKRISDKIFALIDSELTSPDAPLEKDRQEFVNICQKIGINCHVLKYRATENYFTDRAIKSALGEKYSALEEYQVLKKAQPSWGKSENWKIAKEMTKEELEATDLGQFIKKICEQL